MKDEDGNALYGYGKQYSVADIMTVGEEDNPEVLFRFFGVIHQILKYYQRQEYGRVIQILRNKEEGKDKFFQSGRLDIKRHNDKEKLKDVLQKLCEIYSESSNVTVGDVLTYFSREKIIKVGVSEQFQTEQYAGIMQVPVKEFVKLSLGMENQEISTQHGVKGEGHDQVFFIANDCSALGIAMYEFFRMCTEKNVEFQSMQEFYYAYKQDIEDASQQLPKEILTSADVYKQHYPEVKEFAERMDEKFRKIPYYQFCYEEYYRNGIAVKNAHKYIKDYMNINTIKSILLAYKLFYVGCSRAKKKLTVFVSEKKIKKFETEFIKTFREKGFKVEKVICGEQ